MECEAGECFPARLTIPRGVICWPDMKTNPMKVTAVALPGEIIRAKREALGMTREELAEYVGVEARTLWRWELGRGRYGSAGWPKPDAFAKLLAKMKTLARNQRKRQTITVEI